MATLIHVFTETFPLNSRAFPGPHYRWDNRDHNGVLAQPGSRVGVLSQAGLSGLSPPGSLSGTLLPHILSGQQDPEIWASKKMLTAHEEGSLTGVFWDGRHGTGEPETGAMDGGTLTSFWNRLRTWGPHDEDGGDTVPTAEGSGDEGAPHGVRKDSAVQMEEGCPVRWKSRTQFDGE